MRIRKLAAAAALGIAALGLSACATGLNTQVSRFQPAQIVAGPELLRRSRERHPGQSLLPLCVDGLAAARGAGLPARRCAADSRTCWSRSITGSTRARPRFATSPISIPATGRLGLWLLWPTRSIPRWGGHPFYYGWDDPFAFGSPYSSRLTSYTVYKSHLDVDIVRRADNAPLFEGHAQARSRPTSSMSWCRASSPPCSPASPAGTARRSGSRFRQRKHTKHSLWGRVEPVRTASSGRALILSACGNCAGRI